MGMDDAGKSVLRWYRPTPDRLILALLAVELFLRLSDWQGWFPFYDYRGWGVLTTVAVLGFTLPLLPLWFLVSLIFRWRFQYSIRSLLLLAVVVAVACGWLASDLQRAKRQHDSAGNLWANGGEVSYQIGPSATWGTLWQTHSDWLNARFGEDFFATAVEASATNDVASQYLGGLGDVKRLWLNSPAITDAALMNLQGLGRIESLNLRTAAVSDAGLPRLQALGRLENLLLGQTNITDAGLEEIGRLRRLLILDLAETKIGDSELRIWKASTASLPSIYRVQGSPTPAWHICSGCHACKTCRLTTRTSPTPESSRSFGSRNFNPSAFAAPKSPTPGWPDSEDLANSVRFILPKWALPMPDCVIFKGCTISKRYA